MVERVKALEAMVDKAVDAPSNVTPSHAAAMASPAVVEEVAEAPGAEATADGSTEPDAAE